MSFETNAYEFDPAAPVLLIKIIRADTSVIRLCNDAADITNLDGTYTHIGMSVKAPSDDGNSVTKATVSISNDPSVITQINNDNGLERATFILMDAIRGDTDNPYMTLTMTAGQISMNLNSITVQLEHKDLFNKQLVNKAYNFATAPGLY